MRYRTTATNAASTLTRAAAFVVTALAIFAVAARCESAGRRGDGVAYDRTFSCGERLGAFAVPGSQGHSHRPTTTSPHPARHRGPDSHSDAIRGPNSHRLPDGHAITYRNRRRHVSPE